jgi:hypothetical protein
VREVHADIDEFHLGDAVLPEKNRGEHGIIGRES